MRLVLERRAAGSGRRAAGSGRWLRAVGFVLGLIGCGGALAGEGGSQVFATWEGFEADKCASVWLIKRFIAPAAEIRFYPRGESLPEGVAFDTPDARFRRYPNKSTYETLLAHYEISDPKAVYLGRITHDIEVNIWEQKVMPETAQVLEDMPALLSLPDHEAIVEACRGYFDRLYATLPTP